jgi:hypothetical protein
MSGPAPMDAWDAGTELDGALVLDAAPDELAGSADYFVLGIALGAVLSFGLVLSFLSSWLRHLDQAARDDRESQA